MKYTLGTLSNTGWSYMKQIQQLDFESFDLSICYASRMPDQTGSLVSECGQLYLIQTWLSHEATRPSKRLG